jgi:glycosyltransferase involved in cell wall biosynthesis
MVSVMMPCYNAAGTIGTALTSLLLQTYQDWECIVVDDGSTDASRDQILRFTDPRLRYFRLAENNGRGAAQAAALQHARGSLLANLDCDDWYYPDKLERQVHFLTAHPEIASVAVGLALAEPYFRLVGVRSNPVLRIYPAARHPRLNFACGSAMTRTSLARQIGFDPSLRRGHDYKFYQLLLRERAYAILDGIGYVYSFRHGTTVQATCQGLLANLKFHAEHLREYPLFASSHMIMCALKYGLYRLLEWSGLWETYRHARISRPNAEQVLQFQNALRQLQESNSWS